MKWVLVNKLDEIVDSCEIAGGVGISGARTYFVGIKRIEENEFDKLWRVMSWESYEMNFKNTLQNRQLENRKYEWWKDEETYLDADAPITKSGE
tara:strand:+ start:1134 stop:1415 length:282 start_codon:yes stop_codon:yes gene_type:complete